MTTSFELQLCILDHQIIDLLMQLLYDSFSLFTLTLDKLHFLHGLFFDGIQFLKEKQLLIDFVLITRKHRSLRIETAIAVRYPFQLSLFLNKPILMIL